MEYHMDKPMDRIVLTGLEFHAYHGVFGEEAKLGGRFIVDVEITVNFSGALRIEDTVHYGEVFEIVKLEVTGTRHDLIETLANNIAAQVLEAHAPVQRLTVRVHKPFAPIPGLFRDVFVEVTRSRDGSGS
jgi:7,8-dihydroneopterin aldolase/epimerase/oxygenase